jgi:rhamnose utilization protein RhaD (predicted bifunctional aldolase and dehydrogenase)/NAD(P)-dependent dehydrogenase (short-subunit alcohol dehydrogenase family)
MKEKSVKRKVTTACARSLEHHYGVNGILKHMQNLWNKADANQCKTDLELRVYTSRLLGQNTNLVLHGGGNTSVKMLEQDLFGNELELLYVKGSGWDLGTIQAAGFAPVRMDELLKLAKLEKLSDTQMARALRVATVDPSAPAPSVEAILHAILPFKFVDHTHTDALVTVMNTPSGLARVEEIYSDEVVVIPYVMPGFDLAKRCAKDFPKLVTAKTRGMVLMNHGLFTFSDSAQESYENMIELVTRAEKYLERKKSWKIRASKPMKVAPSIRLELATLRNELSSLIGHPVILRSNQEADCLAFAQRADVTKIATRGPATPDHVIRTKRIPLIGRDLKKYSSAYQKDFEKFAKKSGRDLTMLDPVPRIILDPKLGLISVGKSSSDAAIGEDIYRHTIEIISRAEQLESWQALPINSIFEMEYWDLEQAKLKKSGSSPAFTGEITLVTGAASGIGKACVEAMFRRGASVIGLDLNPSITTTFSRPDYLGIVCDITDENTLRSALEAGVRRFGGLDMIVLNAGIFPSSQMIENLDLETWQKVMRVNLDANLSLMREAHPLLKLAPNGGRVAVIASKNVPAPGPGAAAYSASKAALTQLSRVAALEWGTDNIRVNMLHPNAVFDTGIWTPEILEKRAKSYGLSVEAYKTNNVLRVEVSSRDVAELAAELCGVVFAKTTGAQIAIDGGNDRVI